MKKSSKKIILPDNIVEVISDNQYNCRQYCQIKSKKVIIR